MCVEANVSLQLMVDPLRPRAIPECAFLGPDQGKRLDTQSSHSRCNVSVCAMVCKVCVLWSVKCVCYGIVPFAMFIVPMMLCATVYFQWLVQ